MRRRLVLAVFTVIGMPTYLLACMLTALATATLVAGAQPAPAEPAVDTVLQRAALYVEQFHRRLSSIVAEEHYIQEWSVVGRGGRIGIDRRELRSDLALMKPGRDAPWMELRDVFEVDGRAVRDRTDRLETLLREPSGLASAQMSAILRESARFNIGDVDRNVNTPLFALRFLEAGNQTRFRFRRAPDSGAGPITSSPDRVDGVFRVATEVWAIAYDEVRRGTMIRNAQRKDQPSRGRFWIEPATGRVLVSELRVEDRTVRATIDVSFQSEPLMDILVPVAMREKYEGKRTGSLVEGRATYGRFRPLHAAETAERGGA